MTHSLLVDRLRFLPNNTVEGDQVILVRAIAGDQASTNLAVGIHIMGEDKITQSGAGSALMGLIVGIRALLGLVLLATLVFAGLQLRERGFFDSNGNYDEEMGDAVASMMSDKEEAAPDGG